MWELEYSREASNYALDSYPYNEVVLIAIEALALTEDGIPGDGCTELEPGYYLWTIAHHAIVFRRIPGQHPKLRILMIKPEE